MKAIMTTGEAYKPKKLSLRDKETFRYFLGLKEHALSVYHFANIFIWNKHFTAQWLVIRDCLCLFFRSAAGCFMFLPPLGKRLNRRVIRECFAVMDEHNGNKALSRIENAEENDAGFYRHAGFALKEKPGDYVYGQKDLAQLKGNAFKSKRAAVNYFVRHYSAAYVPYAPRYKKECLRLGRAWAEERKNSGADPVYRAMLEDSIICQREALEHARALELTGRVVLLSGNVAGFTLGYELNPAVFCVLFEVCDLRYRGLPQFISRQFCRELSAYAAVNAMDDSGLARLRQVKMSYHPRQVLKNYLVTRNH